jgi:hypothetical protein
LWLLYYGLVSVVYGTGSRLPMMPRRCLLAGASMYACGYKSIKFGAPRRLQLPLNNPTVLTLGRGRLQCSYSSNSRSWIYNTCTCQGPERNYPVVPVSYLDIIILQSSIMLPLSSLKPPLGIAGKEMSQLKLIAKIECRAFPCWHSGEQI